MRSIELLLYFFDSALKKSSSLSKLTRILYISFDFNGGQFDDLFLGV